MQTAHICPLLDLAAYPGRRSPAYSRVDKKSGIIGNGFLEARIGFDKIQHERGVIENKMTGDSFAIDVLPLRFQFAGGVTSGKHACFSRMEARGSDDVASLTAVFDCDWFELEVTYIARRGYHYIQKVFVLRNVRREAHLHHIVPCSQSVPGSAELLVHDGGMYFPIVFVRGKKGGLFYCGDFPGYWVSVSDDRFEFSYHPGEEVRPGRSLQIVTLRIGVTELTGRVRENRYHESGAALDVGERQCFREHLLLGSKLPELPFYELKGPDQDITGVSDLELLDQCEWFGIRHVFLPHMLFAMDSYPLANIVRERMQERGLNAALVMSRGVKRNLHWIALSPDGQPLSPSQGSCFAAEGFRDSLVDRYLAMTERYGFIDVEVRGAPIVPCHGAGHDHYPGIEAIMKAFKGLVEVAEALRENCRHVRCAGPYGSYGAGIARLFDSLSLCAEPHPLPLPDVHIGRLFADMQRLYFRRSHDFLVPKSKLVNTVGTVPESCPDAPYLGSDVYPWYLYFDRIGWRYALISAIATGLRHRLVSIPQDISEEDKLFARKWLDWERKHVDELLRVEELLDEPGLGAVDGYAYAGKRNAIIFLFNPNYDSQDVSLRLHLSHDTDYVARELYPREMKYLGPHDGLFHKNSELRLTLAPKEARVIEVVRRSPAFAKRKRPEVFGALAVDEKKSLRVYGRPGERLQVGIRHDGRFVRQEVRLPGKSLEPQITRWTMVERSYEEGIETLPAGDFPGEAWKSEMNARANMWLCTRLNVPEEIQARINKTFFFPHKPSWVYTDRLFFVIRFEPASGSDPIRTSSKTPGVPEAFDRALPMKCGIDLAPLNLGLKAWVNGEERDVYPSIAAWRGFSPNPHPVVAYFFEAGSKLQYGRRNNVVLFARHFEAAAFRGLFIEHMPDLSVSKRIDLP